jgi:Mg2+ and Co2+ transporter CorA
MKSALLPTEYVSAGPRARLRLGRTERSVIDKELKQECASVQAAAKNSVLLDCYTVKTVVIRSLQAAATIHQSTRRDIRNIAVRT